MDEIIIIRKNELQEIVKDAVDQFVKKDDFDFIRIDEAARLLGTTKPGIYTLVNKRKLPFHKIGRVLYFSKRELVETLRNAQKK